MEDKIELSLKDLEAVNGGATEGSALGSGFFESYTGTGLNIRVDWHVAQSARGKTLEVQVSSKSYSLTSIELQNGVELIVNNVKYPANSAAVDYAGNTITLTPLASFSIPNLSGTVQLIAIWHFKGTYSHVNLDDIRAVGTAVV